MKIMVIYEIIDKIGKNICAIKKNKVILQPLKSTIIIY